MCSTNTCKTRCTGKIFLIKLKFSILRWHKQRSSGESWFTRFNKRDYKSDMVFSLFSCSLPSGVKWGILIFIQVLHTQIAIQSNSNDNIWTWPPNQFNMSVRLNNAQLKKLSSSEMRYLNDSIVFGKYASKDQYFLCERFVFVCLFHWLA